MWGRKLCQPSHNGRICVALLYVIANITDFSARRVSLGQSKNFSVAVVRKTADPAETKLVPAVRYRNPPAAIDWLCTALGFRKHSIIEEKDGHFLRAHLTIGNAMIAVFPVRETGLDRLLKQPDEVGGSETQTCYFFVPDTDTHYRTARNAGAEILIDLADDGHGGRGYSCRDPEGHIWSFGTYDPWDGNTTARSTRLDSRALVVIVVLSVATAAAGAGWLLHSSDDAALKIELSAAHRNLDQAAARAASLDREFARERADKEYAERAEREVREHLARDQAAMLAVHRREAQLADEFAAERRARSSLENLAKEAEDRFAKGKAARETVDRTLSETAKELARERDGRQRAERNAQDAVEQLTRERLAREAAEQVAKEAQRKLSDITPSAKREPPRPAPRKNLPASQKLGAKPPPSQAPAIPRIVP